MARNVMILGMARSGTSLTAAVFARLGYFVGARAERYNREGDDHNPFGYFEADEIVEANRCVLRAVGFEAKNTWTAEPISQAQIDAIDGVDVFAGHRALLERWNEHAPWLWKDPELCLTLPYWRRVVDPETPVVLVTRSREEIYRSFRRMGWCGPAPADRSETMRRIDQHVAAARRAVDLLAVPHAVVDFAEFEHAPAAVAERLSELCDLSIGVGDLNFHPDLNHSRGIRARVAAQLRIAGKHLPERHRERIERLVPRRVLGFVFPERRYGPPRAG